MLSPVTVPDLSLLPGVRHAFFTRQGGVSAGIYGSLNGGQGSSDDPDHVRENRRRMAEHMGVAPDRFISVWQVHSPDALPVSGPWPGERPKADAMVTATPGVALAIGTADCGPILFADGVARVIGAAHAGWRGAFGGVLESTLAAMEALGARRDRTVVALGPMLSRANYEVTREFVDRFIEADAANDRFFSPGRDGRSMFDLPAYITARLERAGVAHVHDTGLCTYADEGRFFSYRRTTHRAEPDYGRLIASIALTD